MYSMFKLQRSLPFRKERTKMKSQVKPKVYINCSIYDIDHFVATHVFFNTLLLQYYSILEHYRIDSLVNSRGMQQWKR